MTEYIEEERFKTACKGIIGQKHNNLGIGTLSEKSVHGVLKNFFEPDKDKQEVALEGYFADIYNENGVIEIQTKNFEKLRNKIGIFINLYPVMIVYPIINSKWTVWIDETTGEVIERRKSPLHMSEYDAFFELYKIKEYLKCENFKICLASIDAEEIRYFKGYSKTKNGVRKRGKKGDKIPLGIRTITTIERIEDYIQFIPFDLENGFTSMDFAKKAKIHIETARIVLNILVHVNAVIRTGKKGRMYTYEVNYGCI